MTDPCATPGCAGVGRWVTEFELVPQRRCLDCHLDTEARFRVTGRSTPLPNQREGAVPAVFAVVVFMLVLIGLAVIAAI